MTNLLQQKLKLLAHHHYQQQMCSSLPAAFINYRQKSKVSASRRLKNALKPLLRRLFKSLAQQPKRNSYMASSESDDDDVNEFDWLHNDMDNRANEHLEHRLRDELNRKCYDEEAAIVVYNEDGTERIQHIGDHQPDDHYVPVHFARTNAGTFFWTSIQRQTIEPYHIQWHFHDRWAQA